MQCSYFPQLYISYLLVQYFQRCMGFVQQSSTMMTFFKGEGKIFLRFLGSSLIREFFPNDIMKFYPPTPFRALHTVFLN